MGTSWEDTSSSWSTISLETKFASLVRDPLILPRIRKLGKLIAALASLAKTGFSRGAYTARALAGLLFKVRFPLRARVSNTMEFILLTHLALNQIGLLPADNLEQVPLAYNHYKRSDDELAAKFKETFCTPVTIDFLGVWSVIQLLR